jgi:7-cyano-7-deazaguanine tRNA-ribosyltransferase
MFEVRATDLGGRLGRLEIGGKAMETPAYLPVVHPIRQQVPVNVLKEMGFKAIMTNSYITLKHHPDGVDIHQLTGFDGVVMTDSGGYQVLEYGDVEVDPVEVAEFQIRIGSDIAVILDRPTGYPSTRSYALQTVKETIAASQKCKEQIAHKPPAWAGPVQGGTHPDIVKMSAKMMAKMDFDLFAIGSPVELMNGYRFREVVKLVTAAKSVLPPEKPVHLFGAGHPFTIPLAVALGCDLFDSASYILFAKQGKYMTPTGVREVKDMVEFACPCTVCSHLSSVRELLELPPAEVTLKLAIHNLYVMKAELSATKEAIREGRLWNYLTLRMKSHPTLTSATNFDEETLRLFGLGLRWGKEKATFFFDETDILNPEVKRHLQRIEFNFTPINKKLSVIVTKNDYDSIFVHSGRMLGNALKRREDTVIFHPYLSVVPLAVIAVHPLAQNVCRNPPPENVVRASVERLVGFAKRYRYTKVVIRPSNGCAVLAKEIRDAMTKMKIVCSVSHAGW